MSSESVCDPQILEWNIENTRNEKPSNGLQQTLFENFGKNFQTSSDNLWIFLYAYVWLIFIIPFIYTFYTIFIFI